jgi:hypothetical protein
MVCKLRAQFDGSQDTIDSSATRASRLFRVPTLLLENEAPNPKLLPPLLCRVQDIWGEIAQPAISRARVRSLMLRQVCRKAGGLGRNDPPHYFLKRPQRFRDFSAPGLGLVYDDWREVAAVIFVKANYSAY